MNIEKQNCPICLEKCRNVGTHRICCLKCDHLFRLNCLVKWFNFITATNNSIDGKCPKCNALAYKNDITILYLDIFEEKNITKKNQQDDERMVNLKLLLLFIKLSKFLNFVHFIYFCFRQCIRNYRNYKLKKSILLMISIY